ncbi:MAG: hypothetical protein A07HB70_01722 [uncultured archaeon A07HB70]|nr:MAG: hypothetical protein A07HB70_01722 [uncultured archaeon A07HB70]
MSLPTDRDARVELGVELLAGADEDALDVAEAVDRVETVTTDPRLVREVLDAAARRGVVEREDGVLRVRRRGGTVRFESDVVERPVDADCRRCGTTLSTGYFVRLPTGDLGPFGSTCVRRVVGRD